ncbi:ABC-type lipoprotein release transport system permease subunit [Ruminiclostridium sufflavum DSM 19573]|uniref:ABC-type lipoprotein release transport system permease subunit n=1 Tax=Ruminiclostridium sufflavum DSM 19573 TaxID=1121337 RepID=A0A318XMW0_9FIRM|nr:ABC transporter permease [Ruminiclostridium sufflavum]PYG88038.1 ABC-type lipoprotein release transport system permease subunit [Ruminiclostridium sufflavum DSM 19573]
MRLILKYLINNLRLKKFRTGLIVVFLILCSFLIIINLGVNDYYEKAYAENIAYEKGKVDLIITPSDSDKLFKEGGVKLSQSQVDNYLEVFTGLGKVQSDEDDIKVNLVGCDLYTLFQNGMIHGIEVDEDVKGYIVISENTRDLLNKAVGDVLSVSVMGKPRKLKITDIAKKSGVFSSDSSNIITVVMDLSKVQKYYGLNNKVSSVYVSLKENADIDETVAAIKRDNTKGGKTTVSINESYDIDSYNQKKSATSLALMAAMIIMLFISIYLISFISKIIYMERMQVMGTFQSVGATPFKTALIFISENVCYGVLGWIGGMLMSIFACPYVFEMLNTFQTNSEIDSTINPAYYVVALVCSVVIMLLCSLGSVFRMNRKTVKELLFTNSKEENGLGLKGIIVGIVFAVAAAALYICNQNYNLLLGTGCFILTVVSSIILCKLITSLLTKLYDVSLGRIFGGAYRFGVDNIRRDKMLGSSVTLITIVVSMLLCIIMVIFGVRSSMKTMIDCNDFDISCTNLTSELRDYKDIEDIDGVEETYFDYLSFTDAYIDENKTASVSIISVDDEEKFYHFRSQSIKYPREKAQILSEGRYALIDSFWADKNSVKIGDTIKFNDKESGKVIDQEYEVIDFINSSGFVTTRDAIMIGQKYFDLDLDVEPYQYLIKISRGYDADTVARDVSNELIKTSTVVKTISEVVEDSMSGVNSLILILYIIIGISVLLIIFGVINNITVSFLSRKRELAVLYSTAMSRRQLITMFYGEIITMYVVIIFYAGALSFLYQYIMPKILWSAGLAFNMQYPVFAIIITSIALFIVLNILVLIPVVNLFKMNTVEVLKYE